MLSTISAALQVSDLPTLPLTTIIIFPWLLTVEGRIVVLPLLFECLSSPSSGSVPASSTSSSGGATERHGELVPLLLCTPRYSRERCIPHSFVRSVIIWGSGLTEHVHPDMPTPEILLIPPSTLSHGNSFIQLHLALVFASSILLGDLLGAHFSISGDLTKVLSPGFCKSAPKLTNRSLAFVPLLKHYQFPTPYAISWLQQVHAG